MRDRPVVVFLFVLLLVVASLAGCARSGDVGGVEGAPPDAVVLEVGGSARVAGVAGESEPVRLRLVNASRGLDVGSNDSFRVQLVEPAALLRVGLTEAEGWPHFLLQSTEGCPMVVDDAGEVRNATSSAGWTLTPERSYVGVTFQAPCSGTFSLRATFPEPSAAGDVSSS